MLLYYEKQNIHKNHKISIYHHMHNIVYANNMNTFAQKQVQNHIQGKTFDHFCAFQLKLMVYEKGECT